MTLASVFLLWVIGVVFCLFGGEHPVVILMRRRCVGGWRFFLCVLVCVILVVLAFVCGCAHSGVDCLAMCEVGALCGCFFCGGCVGMRWE